MLLKRCKFIACKAGAVLLALVVLVVPFCGVMASAEIQDPGDYPTIVPDKPFTCYYYDLELGENVVTPEFSALPQQIYHPNGVSPITDYIIVKGRDVYGNATYYAHLFTENQQPTDIDVVYSYSGTNEKMDALKSHVLSADYASGQTLFMLLGGAFVERFKSVDGAISAFVPVWGEIVFGATCHRLREEYINNFIANSNDFWEREMRKTLNSDAAGLYASYCGDGVHPWIDITLSYSQKIQSYIAFYTDVNGTWQWINSYPPSQAYTYTIAGAEAIVASSIDVVGGGVLSGTKSAFVEDLKDEVEQGLIESPIRKYPPSSPSWNGSNNGSSSGSGGLGDSFVSGSFYNDAGTGNPFVAAFIAPWVGINWTYENVATDISLFGVSLADMVATMLVLIVSAFLVSVLVKAVT